MRRAGKHRALGTPWVQLSEGHCPDSSLCLHSWWPGRRHSHLGQGLGLGQLLGSILPTLLRVHEAAALLGQNVNPGPAEPPRAAGTGQSCPLAELQQQVGLGCPCQRGMSQQLLHRADTGAEGPHWSHCGISLGSLGSQGSPAIPRCSGDQHLANPACVCHLLRQVSLGRRVRAGFVPWGIQA